MKTEKQDVMSAAVNLFKDAWEYNQSRITQIIIRAVDVPIKIRATWIMAELSKLHEDSLRFVGSGGKAKQKSYKWQLASKKNNIFSEMDSPAERYLPFHNGWPTN